jgi:ubiquinone/menaquinone biosynthesis C-methylase UbiE
MDTFSQLAKYYDALYFKEDLYAAESKFVIQLIEKYKLNSNNKVLDIACGTGTHIKFFHPRFQVSGLDLSADMLAIAGKRYPEITFYQSDMTDFSIDERFGVVLCLYGSIGFVRTRLKLQKALRLFSQHLDQGGVLIFTPWSTLEDFRDTLVSDRIVTSDVQIVRMEKVKCKNKNTVAITYHYLIGENGEVRYYKGQHPPLRLFSCEEYEDAIKQAGLEIVEIYRGSKVQMGLAYVCRK